MDSIEIPLHIFQPRIHLMSETSINNLVLFALLAA